MLKRILVASGILLAAITSGTARVEDLDAYRLKFVCQGPGLSPITILAGWNRWKWRDRQGSLSSSLDETGPDTFNFSVSPGGSVREHTTFSIQMESAPEKTVRSAMIQISRPVDYGHSSEMQVTNVRGACKVVG